MASRTGKVMRESIDATNLRRCFATQEELKDYLHKIEERRSVTKILKAARTFVFPAGWCGFTAVPSEGCATEKTLEDFITFEKEKRIYLCCIPHIAKDACM